MGRSPCCDGQTGLKKGPWTTEEDQKLVDYINRNGHGSWRALPKLAGLNRCGKSCRLRWTNYLRPDIKRGKFSEEEERVIINLHAVVGNKWSKIATHLPGRTDNEIKNYWNTHLRKKLLQMGLDPNTHKPRTYFNHLLNLSQLLNMASVGNMMTSTPWENALRLQASAAQLAKMQLLQNVYMQVMNSSLANPDINNKTSTGVFGSQNINLFGGNFNVASTMLRDQEWNGDSIPVASDEFNTTSNSLEGCEGFNSNINNNLSCYDVRNFQNKFPDLVLSSSSPGRSTTNTKSKARVQVIFQLRVSHHPPPSLRLGRNSWMMVLVNPTGKIFYNQCHNYSDSSSYKRALINLKHFFNFIQKNTAFVIH